MSRRLYRHPQAVSDAEESAVYIGEDNPAAAARFLDALEATFKTVLRNPEIGRSRDFGRRELFGVRSFAVQGFERFLVFYRPTTQGIAILRVLHGARDLGPLFE